MSKMKELQKLGQSIWLDYISRDLIQSGGLQDLVDRGLMGVTSNPAIFQKALSEGHAYDSQLANLAEQKTESLAAYEALAIRDIQQAADILRPVYDATDGVDGYVSLEVNPHLAYETNGTIAEAERLYAAVDRPNVMIKVPATEHGLVAIERLIGQGININVTLMFSMAHYDAVVMAYIAGVEALKANGGDLSKVASVASFFVSRVDAKLDPILDELGAKHLKGKIAIANSKQVYKRFEKLFSGERWEALASAGARVQRPLWASTSTKDPSYPDTLYVDSLIGPHTVNTLPPETLDAFADHGTIERTVDADMAAADKAIAELTDYNINLLEVGEELQSEGVDKFNKPFDTLLQTITHQLKQVM